VTNKTEQLQLNLSNARLTAALKNLEEVVESKIAQIQQEKQALEKKLQKLEAINHKNELSRDSIKKDLEKIKNIINPK
jgi:transposase